MIYMPDMRRNIFAPDLILANVERQREGPVVDELPTRVKAVLLSLESRSSGGSRCADDGGNGFWGSLFGGR